MGCHFLLQGFFLTQGMNPCLASPSLAGGIFITSTTWETHNKMTENHDRMLSPFTYPGSFVPNPLVGV